MYFLQNIFNYKKEDYKSALQYYNKSLKYKQRLNDSLGMGTAMNNIGCVFFQDKNYNKAINHFEKATSILHEHVKNGDIKFRETITPGFENAPQGLRDVLSGKNFGKQIIKII